MILILLYKIYTFIFKVLKLFYKQNSDRRPRKFKKKKKYIDDRFAVKSRKQIFKKFYKDGMSPDDYVYVIKTFKRKGFSIPIKRREKIVNKLKSVYYAIRKYFK